MSVYPYTGYVYHHNKGVPDMAVSQERKTERITLAVTEGEKQAALAVAAAVGERDHSVLLRDMSLNEIKARAKGMKKALAGR